MSVVARHQVPQFHFPEPITTTTSNGARIFMVPMETAKTVSVAVFAQEGYSTEPASGLAALTASMLPRGTRYRNEFEFVSAIDRLGATLQPINASRKLGVTIVGLPEHTEQHIGLLAECILEPAFDPTEFDKARTQLLASFPLFLAQSSYRARRIFSKLRYPNHPFSRPTNGTPASVAAIDCEQIRQWYSTILQSSKWHILMIGAFDAQTVGLLLERSFAPLGFSQIQPIPAPADPPPAIGVGQGIMTDQVELRLGVPALPYTSSDYAATLLVSTAFAGHFRSRINLLVREHEGLTYGAYGGLTASKQTGTFVLSTSTTPENFPRMIELLREQWQKLATEPFRDDELLAARQYLYSTFWQSIETPDGIASIAIELALNELPNDYYGQLLARLDQLTPSQLLPVQQSIFSPSRLLIAAVGERQPLEMMLSPYGTPQHVLLEEEQQ